MCTARFSGHRGGVCLGVCVQAVSAQGGVHPTGPRGRPPPPIACMLGYTSPAHCMLGYKTPPTPTPWTEGMTHTCENISLFASGRNCLKHPKILMNYVCVPLCSIWERNHNFNGNKIIRHAFQCGKSVSIWMIDLPDLILCMENVCFCICSWMCVFFLSNVNLV